MNLAALLHRAQAGHQRAIAGDRRGGGGADVTDLERYLAVLRRQRERRERAMWWRRLTEQAERRRRHAQQGQRPGGDDAKTALRGNKISDENSDAEYGG